MKVSLDLFRLDDRLAIVTGASRGIGHAISRGLSSAGAKVIGIGRTEPANVNSSEFAYARCDVTDKASFNVLIDDIFCQTGRIDILVNAAGITLPNNNIEYSADSFRRTIACNLSAVFDCCSVVIPCMQRGGYGSIVNVTSICGSLGFPGNPGYVASKGGLAALTRALALDHGLEGIRINSLVPGYIHTAMTQGSYSNFKSRQERSSRTMLGRWGETEELMGPTIFLCSPASSYVTGTELFVDGGWSAKGL